MPERVFSARLLTPNLKFIRQVFGREAEEALYREWGVTREEAADAERWVTYECALDLARAMVRVTGDRDVMYKAGIHHATTPEFGVWFYLIKLLGSPRLAYQRVPALTANMSSVTEMRAVEVGDESAVLEFCVGKGVRDDPLFDQKRRGSLACIPLAFGLAPAEVTEEKCLNRGDDCCRYQIRWQNARASWRPSLLVAAGVTVLGIAALLALGGSIPAAVALGILLFGASALVHRGVEDARVALARMSAQEGQIQALEQMMGSNRRHTARLELLRSVSDLLHRARSEEDLLRQAADIVREKLGFHRVIYWGREGDQLVVKASSGLSEEHQRYLAALWLPYAPDLAGRPPDLPLFGLLLQRLEARRVNNVVEFQQVNSERGRQIFDLLQPGPFAAAPVLGGGVGVGLLVAEMRRGGETVSDADLSMIQQVASQLSLALDNVRLLEQEKRFRLDLQASLELERKYSLYLPPKVVATLREHPEQGSFLQPEILHVGILFVDMVGFSRASTELPERAVLDWLNLLFREADDAIQARGGIIDKRLGDGILAVFPGDGAAGRALASVQDLQERVSGLRQELQQRGLPPIRLRAGLSWGRVIAGTIGTDVRYEYTVLGQTVNLAQRLQGVAAPDETVLSVEAWVAAGQPAGPSEETATVRGFPAPIPIRRMRHFVEVQVP